MFDYPYPYRKINILPSVKQGESDYHCTTHNYAFNGKDNIKYRVLFEEYDYNLFVVKYYLQFHKNRKDKYNLLTNNKDSIRILSTVGSLFREIYLSNPYASFGFVGSELPDEEKRNTKRFRLYKKVLTNVIPVIHFHQAEIEQKSVYIIINKHQQEKDIFKKTGRYDKYPLGILIPRWRTHPCVCLSSQITIISTNQVSQTTAK